MQIRVTADTLDSLIMGPLPVVLVSLSSNPVMDLPDFGSEWVLSPVAPNGSYVMAAGGRTLEDIVRTVAADFTESVVLAQPPLRAISLYSSLLSAIPHTLPLTLHPAALRLLSRE